MAVSKRLRYEVLRRDNHACRYCGRAAPDVPMTVDHVIPKALGGGDEPTNLVAACEDCNSGKTSSNPDAPLVADVDQRAVRWSQAMNAAIEQRRAELAADRTRTAAFDAVWSAWSSGGRAVPRDPTWKATVLRFLAAGLDDEFLADAVSTAMGNTKLRRDSVWRYFCGICWRELDRIRELAGAHYDGPLLATPPVSSPDSPLGISANDLAAVNELSLHCGWFAGFWAGDGASAPSPGELEDLVRSAFASYRGFSEQGCTQAGAIAYAMDDITVWFRQFEARQEAVIAGGS